MLIGLVRAHFFQLIKNYYFTLYRMAAVPLKRQENVLSKRPPVSRAASSQEGLSELASETIVRGKNILGGSTLPSEGML